MVEHSHEVNQRSSRPLRSSLGRTQTYPNFNAFRQIEQRFLNSRKMNRRKRLRPNRLHPRLITQPLRLLQSEVAPPKQNERLSADPPRLQTKQPSIADEAPHKSNSNRVSFYAGLALGREEVRTGQLLRASRQAHRSFLSIKFLVAVICWLL